MADGSGGNKVFNILAGDVISIANFGAVGTGNNPSGGLLAELDQLKFSGAGLTAANMRLQQVGADVVVTFYNDPSHTTVTLTGVNLNTLDNVTTPGSQVYGNFIFDGEAAVSDSIDVQDSTIDTGVAITGSRVNFLNAADNNVAAPDLADTVINGGDGNDTITGGSGDDVLRGEDGNDILVGGGGDDTLDGGAGNDRLNLAGSLTASDKIDGGSGNDTLTLNGDYSAGVTFAATTMVNVETVTVAAGHDYKLTLNDANNTSGLTVYGTALGAGNTLEFDDSAETSSSLRALGGAGDDKISGGGGNDTLTGNDGDDTLSGGGSNDHLDGNAGDDVLSGGDGNDYIDGGSGNDTLNGDKGDDTLVSGTGSDTLNGGVGNDVFNLAGNLTASDKIDGGSGNDRLLLNGDYSAGVTFAATTMVNVETVTVAAGHDYKLSLNDTNNTSGLTVDASALGAGNILEFDDSAETVSQLHAIGGAGDDKISGGSGNDTLAGNGGNDTLAGGDGNDFIDGGAGNDTMTGGVGDDTYVVDRIDDVVSEVLGSGIDTVISSISYNLGAGSDLENLTLVGSSPLFGVGNELDNVIIAGDGNGTLFGGLGNDTLIGGSGDDTLDGGVGNDAMSGGDGDDTYVVDSAGDTVSEAGGDGTDTVFSTLTYDLGTGSGVENLTLLGSTNLDGIGNELANEIQGNSGANTLTGGAGDDAIDGGTGHDTAVFAGSFADYNISFSGATITVGDTVAARDGTDTLTSVESLQFSDKTVLIVDQSGAFGSFTTIQSAVDAAAGMSGEVVVLVRSGNYQEQVQVSGHNLDDLTIQAAANEAVTVSPPTTPWVSTANSPTSGRDYDGLITVKNADDVTIKGLTVDGQELGNSAHLVGSSDPSMAGVVFVNSTGGVIDGVTVTGIREGDTGFGNQRNVGIVVLNDNPSPGTPHTPTAGELAGLNTITIKDSTVENFQKTGIQVSYADVTLDNNTVTGIGSTTWTAQNGIQVSGSTGDVTNNHVSDIGYIGSSWAASGILTFENRDLVIDGNDVTGTVTDSTIGIAAEDSVNTAVTHNTVTGIQYPIDLEDYPTGSGWPDPLSAEGHPIDLSSNILVNTGEGAYFEADAARTEAFDVTGTSKDDTIITGAGDDTIHGGDGADTIDGGAGKDAMFGGDGDDTYTVDNVLDTVDESTSNGVDTVETYVDYTLSAKVENLTLLEGKASQTIDFDSPSYAAGPITNGENGWKVVGPNPGGGIEASGDPEHATVYRIANDPANGAFGGPYTPELSVKAGELSAGADTNQIAYTLNFKPAGSTPDGSRVEIDFANAAGTDRQNFMALEYTADGIRLAVNEPTTTKDDWSEDTFAFGTGNITLASGIDPNAWHNIQVVLTANDGPNNDVVQIYLDGKLVGTSTSFENYRDYHVGNVADHDTHVADNLMDRLIFRVGEASGNPYPADGAGGNRQGFLIDDIHTAAGAAINGTGNDDANVITGNSLGNGLAGMGGDDTINAGAGDDTLTGGAGNDALDGGTGHDTAVFAGNFADYDISIDGGSLVVKDTKPGVDGDDGKDTLTSVESLKFADTATLIVDQSGTFGEYETIQSAVDAAESMSGHVTILVMAGHYAENVVIDRSDLALVSQAGAGTTFIDGVQAGGELGAVQLKAGADDVTIGAVGHGFTITGIDGTPGLEKGAIYLQGDHDGLVIQGNNVVANGDAGLMSEFGSAITTALIDGNEFSGQTFNGPNPGGIGFGSQFTTPDVPRQLVVLGNGGGAGESASQHITFTNNVVSGTTGGLSAVDGVTPQGNTLVTIDASHSTIEDNTFTGDTGGPGYALRARRDDTSVSDNTLDQTGSGDSAGILIQNSTLPASSFAGNEFHGGAGDAVILSMTPGNDTLTGGSGNEILSGSGGDDTITGGDGNDTLNGGTGADQMTGGDGNDTYVVDSAGDTVNEAGSTGTDTVQSSITYSLGAGSGVENLTLTGSNAINGTGNELGNTITGNGLDNVLEGKGGNDTIDGGAGSDTAVFTGALGEYTFDLTTVPGSVVVHDTIGSRDGTDTVTNVEALQFSDAQVLVVGNGGFATIQAAIDAASANDTILVTEGTYAENVNVNKSVSIVGAGDGTVIEGTFRSDNGVPNGTTVGDWLETHGSYTGASGSGLAINADGVTIANVKVTGFNTGILLNTNDGLTLNGVHVDDSVRAIYKEDGSAEVTNFAMNGGTLSNSYQGIIINANGDPLHQGEGSFDGVTIDGTVFEHLTEKGIYVEQLSNALIDNVTMTDVGEFGRGPAFGPAVQTGQFGAGIDVNLKYDSFSNITIQGFDFQGVGHSFGTDLTADGTGGAILIKARDDGGYSTNAATVTNVTVQNGTIDGTGVGIRTGEPAKGNADPDVTVDNVAITNALITQYDNQTHAVIDVTLTDGNDTVSASAQAVGEIDFHGLKGDDSITGGGGNDVLDGGEGNDTLSGAGGNDAVNGDKGDDTVVYHVGDGQDTVDGGDDTDTLQIDNGGGTPITFDVTAAGADPVHVAITGGGTVDASNVEELTFNLGSGGDTVNIGSLDGTSVLTSTITVHGGDGADIVDASDIASGNPVGVVFDGGKGADTFYSGAGSDTFDGGEGDDTASYAGNFNDYIVTWDGETATVEDKVTHAVDTLTNVGQIDFADRSAFLVGQSLTAEYTTIQSGVTNAGDGDVVLVGEGVYAENVTVNGKAVTIDGVGRGATNTELDGTITYSGTIDGAAKVSDMIVNAAGHQYGVYVSAGSTAFGGAFTLDNVLVENAQTNGFAYILAGNEVTPTLSGTLGDITIENSVFSGNATVNSGPGGRGDIILFGFNQDVTIDGVSFDSAGAGAQKAIQVRGLQNGSNVFNAGVFTFNGINVTGSYQKDLIAIVNYAGFADFLAAGNMLNASAPWGLVHLDGVGGTVDLSGFSGTNGDASGIVGAIEDRGTDDTIFGTDGHDVFADNLGADTLKGNGGDDTFVIADPALHPAGESIDGGNGTDTILFIDNTDGHLLTLHGVTNVENVTIGDTTGATTGTHALSIDASSMTTDVTLTGNDGDNTLTGGSGNDHLVGNGGNDVLNGGGGDDTLDGGAGNDTLDGGSGTNHLNGGQGDDLYFVHSGTDLVTEVAGQGTDTVDSSAASYTLPSEVENLVLDMAAGDINGTGNGGANTITGNDGANVIDGAGGADTLAGGKGDDQLIGGIGIDKLDGGEGNDTLSGGTGSDTLHGGVGDDTMTGGSGADSFQFDSFLEGKDTITDFDGENDYLSFKASLDTENNGIVDNINAAITSIDDTTVGGDVVVHFGGGNSITFQGIGTATSHGNDITTLVSDPSQIVTHA